MFFVCLTNAKVGKKSDNSKFYFRYSITSISYWTWYKDKQNNFNFQIYFQMKEKFVFLEKNAILRQYKTASLRRAACRQKKESRPSGRDSKNKQKTLFWNEIVIQDFPCNAVCKVFGQVENACVIAFLFIPHHNGFVALVKIEGIEIFNRLRKVLNLIIVEHRIRTEIRVLYDFLLILGEFGFSVAVGKLTLLDFPPIETFSTADLCGLCELWQREQQYELQECSKEPFVCRQYVNRLYGRA